ncbi:MAG TPA: phage tail tube protein [Candidatus Flavonifractor merdavium]|nr:phage tail tube protein [Candidatus Flavonifractor merdavium]
MARNRFSARKIPNGTYGSVWLDGERLAECYGCQGKVNINSDKINLCGEFMEANKPVSGSGSGSLMLYKVDSGLIQRMQRIQEGDIPEMTVVSKLADPTSAGAERIAYYGVQFSDLTLADWQAATSGKITAPFTFTKFELLDAIPVQ